MYFPKRALQCPEDFQFPFKPYDIQQQLMQDLYKVLENKQIGVFESPTGTGKSLTLTCAALKWLEDHELLVRTELQERLEEVQKEVLKLEKESQKASDWISQHSKTFQQRKELLQLKDVKNLLTEFEENLKEMKGRQKLLKESRSNERKNGKLDPIDGYNIEEDINIVLDDLDEAKNEENHDILEKSEKYRDVQIFFCSRTHTQLAQVVREIKRTVYGQRVRCISLASRQQLCIHKQLRKLNNTTLINEKCLDMSKGTKTTKSKPTLCDGDGCTQKKAKLTQKTTTHDITKCSFKSQSLVQDLSDLSLIDILDIEDLVMTGEQLQACPYYAARSATQMAQIIMLPYQLLLHKRTRELAGIDLKGSIVIIDEAHNLLDTISQMHSCELNLQQLQASHQQILSYKIKYASRFSSSNLLSINQLLFVIKRLIKLLMPSNKAEKTSSFRLLCTYEIMSEGDFFNIDLYQLLQFCERSRFAQKLQGFAKRMDMQPNPNENQPPVVAKSSTVGLLQRLQQDHKEKQQKSYKGNLQTTDINQSEIDVKVKDGKSVYLTSPIRPLLAFLEALCEKAEDGRILLNITDESLRNYETQCSFKYILLNPGAHFQDIVKETRAIIVAGGTMQPTNELTEQLFNTCPERVQLRFYDHVVPNDAVLPFVVTKGPRGKNLCFNYAQRNSLEMLTDLCNVLENLCNVIPAGLVCFLPSYDYLDTVYGQLQKSGVFQRISNKKRIFREPRNVTTNDSGQTEQTVEQLLADYAKAIKHNQGGALLLSVVGAKLSEGLNFADDLGRGVIVVGMPYPNRNSPELQERMAYLDETLGAGSGSEYYENLCMKAVNQCIGRSVRHIGDYACVYLLDERYARENIQRKLPQWISRHVQVAHTYGKVQAGTAKFFKLKKVM